MKLSLPSSPPRSDSEDGSECSQDELSSARGQHRVVLTPRTPHPRSVRHSSRSEARKPVLYSTKHHPQDYGLPGYSHRAIVIDDSHATSSQKIRERHMPPASTQQPRECRLTPPPPQQQQHNKPQEELDCSPDEIPARPPRKAHKKLKSLGRDHSSSAPAACDKRDQPVKKAKIRKRAVCDSSDLESLVDAVIAGSQYKRADPPSVSLYVRFSLYLNRAEREGFRQHWKLDRQLMS